MGYILSLCQLLSAERARYQYRLNSIGICPTIEGNMVPGNIVCKATANRVYCLSLACECELLLYKRFPAWANNRGSRKSQEGTHSNPEPIHTLVCMVSWGRGLRDHIKYMATCHPLGYVFRALESGIGYDICPSSAVGYLIWHGGEI